jgi:tetratricopeptide (TPR) repeat protein
MSRKWEGYDLGIDPAESSNIFSEIDSRFADMRRLLDKYIYEGERLEPASIPKSDESGIMRSLEALGYIEKSAQQPEGNMAFYSALNEGKKLINLGKYPEAIERITTALSVRKVDEGLKHGARMCLADACRRLKRTDEAAKYLEEVVKGCGDPILVSQAAVNLAGIYGENGEIDKAVSILDGLLSSIPQIPVKAEISVRSKRAAIYRQAEECQKAAADYEEILRKAPNEIDACYNLGSLFEHIAEYSKAQACFQQVLRMPTSNTQKYHGGAHYHLADISLKKSLGSTAEQSLRQCLTINPKHNAAKEKLSQVAEAYAKR